MTISIKFTEKYDLITLVGVLEYLPYYTLGDPRIVCEDFLKELKGCLKEDGIIIIGIENKLGAKYFSGCHEDHTGRLFDGIMDYPRKSPVTFSRNEIEEMLNASGMTNTCFYHVFPDYKLPKLFLKETKNNDYSVARGWFKGYFEDMSRERLYFFHDTLFIETLIKSKLLHHFSNSFLVVASVSDEINLSTDFIIRKFWNQENTNPSFHHVVTLLTEGSTYYIERSKLNDNLPEIKMDKVHFKLIRKERYLDGRPLSTEVYKSLFKDDNFISLGKLVEEIKDSLLSDFFKGTRDTSGYEEVDGKSIDYCFWNLLRAPNGRLLFIDNKWSYDSSLTADDVLFRNLNGLYYDVRYHTWQIPFSEFVVAILSKIYPHYNIERFYKNIRIDLDFSNAIMLSPKSADHYIMRDTIDYVRIKPGDIMQLQGKLSGRAWKLLERYYSVRDYIRKTIRR